MKAVIQAGGLGTRLKPMSLEMPKPLITVKRKPILNHLLELFTRYGVNESVVIIHKDHREDYVWWQKRYRGVLPPSLRLIIEPEPLGTFGGLRFLKDDLRETFMMTNGDELKDFDLSALINFHKKNPQRPLATIALVRVPNPSDYGVPIMKGSQIKEFLEKPGRCEKCEVNANDAKKMCSQHSHLLTSHRLSYISSGLYILEPEVFKYADWPRGHLMIEKDIFPKLAAAGKLAGYKVKNGKWQDCGTFARWEKAIKEWS